MFSYHLANQVYTVVTDSQVRVDEGERPGLRAILILLVKDPPRNRQQHLGEFIHDRLGRLVVVPRRGGGWPLGYCVGLLIHNNS